MADFTSDVELNWLWLFATCVLAIRPGYHFSVQQFTTGLKGCAFGNVFSNISSKKCWNLWESEWWDFFWVSVAGARVWANHTSRSVAQCSAAASASCSVNRVDRDEIGGQVRAYLGHAGMPASSPPPPHLSSKIYPLLLSFRLTVSGLVST